MKSPLPAGEEQGEGVSQPDNDLTFLGIREAADLWLEVVAERVAREAQAVVPDAEVQEIDL